MRILLNPEAESGGGANPPVPPAPVAPSARTVELTYADCRALSALQFRVQTRTLEAVSDFLRDQLIGPEYEHFLKPSGTSGSGARGGAQTPPNHRANLAPSSPDDEVFARWQAAQSRLAEQGFGARGL